MDGMPADSAVPPGGDETDPVLATSVAELAEQP
jgi:hypothetical protein